MISELCSAFVNVAVDNVDAEINRWLAFIVTYLGVDRGTLFQISDDHTTSLLTHTWAASKSLSLDRGAIADLSEAASALPWAVEKMLRREPVIFSSVDELPAAADTDKQFFEENGTKSVVTFPLSVGGEVIGAVAFSAVRMETHWSDELIRRLQMVAHVFANALARKRADIERRGAIERYRTLFEFANDAIIVLKGDVIIDCNERCVPLFSCGDKSELIGHPPWEFAPPHQDDGEDSVERTKRLLDLAKNGIPQKFFWKYRRKDESVFDAEVSLNAFRVSRDILLLAIVRDITVQLKAEEVLRETNDRLQSERALLAEKNAALRTILTQLEEQRIEHEEKVCSSLEHMFAPYLKKLRKGEGQLSSRELTELEDAFESIVGKGVNTFKENYAKLSPREAEICELIAKGLSSKEISEALNVAPQTVHKHREIIRRKLGIQNLEINLPTYLRSKL
ncbi:MAG: LuxR C-terminal-related transcriptional regulator [Candidatus Zixiibacteriota bacterium]